ncbi:MAG: prenyltransferase [Muribaculaceae bacterium]|nr:prenyltransferase [Muribaculaceae bacterium]
MNAIQIIKTAIAPATLWIGVASVVAGSAAAVSHGNFEFLPAVACLIFCIFGQMFSNVTHRYYDDKNNYGENHADGMYYCEDLDRPVSFVLRETMRVTGIIAATAGLAILAFAGWWALIIALVIGILVLFTNIGPYPISRTAYYPVMTFLFFGPIAVVGTCIVQSQASAQHLVSWWDLEPAVVMSVIIGLMAINCHVIYGAFHRASHVQSSRTTFIGRYGKKGFLGLIMVITIAYAAIGVIAPITMNLMDKPWLYIPIPVLSAVFNYYTVKLALKSETVHKAWHYSIYNMVAFAVLSFIILCIIGYPEGYMDNAPALFLD